MPGLKRLSRIRIFSALGEARGNAAIEFALSFPILIVVTLMIFDIGRGLFVLTTINHLASEGARYGSVRGAESPTSTTTDAVVTYIQGRATGMDLNELKVTVIFNPSAFSGSNIEVEISYNFRFFVSGFFPSAVSGITISAESNMTIL